MKFRQIYFLLSVSLSAKASAIIRRQSPSWNSATCTTPEVTDASIDQTKRWNSVDTEGAWKAVMGDWKVKGSNGLTFTQEVSNFFNGPEQMLCGDISARDGCGSYIVCNNVNHPAGMFILNSFVAISSLNYDIYDAIGKAEGNIVTQMGLFAETFAPIEDLSAGLKLALDLVGLGFALAFSPVWNSALKAVPFFKANPNTLGTIKDWTNPAISNGITIAKDTSISGATLSAQNDLTTNVGNLIKSWYATFDTYNQQLFNGSDVGNTDLYNSVTGGKVLEPGYQEDELDVQGAIEKAIFGYLIPQAWPLSNLDVYPVVIDAQAPCGTTNPIDQYVADDDGLASYVCYDGGLYYLLATTSGAGDSLSCDGGGDGTAVACSPNTFPVLPGIDKLDGKAWGGVIRDDFVAGAVNSFNANGKANGWGPTDTSNDVALDDLLDNGIRAVGVLSIPVCTGEEAMDNWYISFRSEIDNYFRSY